MNVADDIIVSIRSTTYSNTWSVRDCDAIQNLKFFL